jgi:hypothetical protein
MMNVAYVVVMVSQQTAVFEHGQITVLLLDLVLVI